MSATDKTLREAFGDETPARFWRSLDELSGTPSFRIQLAREFPEIAARFGAATNRRTALKLLGASLLMAGVAACKAPDGIAAYVTQPEYAVPGKARYFATSAPLDGYGMGVLAESHDGRPTKIEGNPLHPGSLGGTDAIMQASVWSLYDPSRSRDVRHGPEIGTWSELQAEMAALRNTHLPIGGRGIGVVIGAETSPTTARQLTALKQAMPELRVYRHAPLFPLEETVEIFDLEQAQTLVALDGDFLGEGPGKLAYAQAFADGRRVRNTRRQMSRLYAIETVPTLTGANADWKRAEKLGELDGIVAGLVGALADGAVPAAGYEALVKDAQSSRTLFIAGSRQSEFVRGAARWLNSRAAAPVRMIASPLITGDGSIADLATDIGAGRIDALLILDVDLVHSAPGDLDMTVLLQRVSRVYHHGLHLDATAKLAHWHVPATHYLESWSDLRAYDGTSSLLQPLIAPLYQGRTAHEVLATLAGDYATPARDLLRATWPQLDDAAWMSALQRGVVDGTAAAPQTVATTRPSAPTAPAASALSLVIAPDPYLRDGTWAANLPLNELPRPLSKLVWGNAAEMSAATAKSLSVVDGDEVELKSGNRAVRVPTFVLPGMPDATIALAAGWGRITGSDAPVGANAFVLMGGAGDLSVTRTGQPAQLITTQEHHGMEGRDIVREVELADWPGPAPVPEEQPSLMPKWDEPDEAWGMSIDLTSCIGCMACVSACQAENNSPIVGADEMARGHDMHWLRVDRYFSGDPTMPETSFQPVPCMQCEDAPCEVVCPVNATVHTHDGLNAQVYNRCVGTRYCSQNCPYKVRRFNFFDYNADISETSPLSLLMNPDVSVRERGVMEKCTYCVQRISEARIGADIADSPIADGSVMTACQQACPTRAISFGNVKDKTARVVAEKAEPTSYAMLAELGTKPRTTYIAKVRNRVG